MKTSSAIKLAAAIGLVTMAALVSGCGAKSSAPRAGGASARPASLQGVAEKYREYAIAECDSLVKGTRAFAAAITAGDQERLAAADALNEYISHVGSAVFAIFPGARAGGYIGETLLH